MDSIESHVLDFMKCMKQSAASWMAVYFNLSKLKQHNQTPLMLESARIHSQKCLHGHNSHVFILSNNDLIGFVQNIGLIKIEKIVMEFRKFFADDPLSAVHMDRELFYRSYHLGQAFDTLLDKIDSIKPHQGADHSQYIPHESAPVLPFDLLVRLQNTLKQADISNFMRRQYICWLDAKDHFKRIAVESYLSMGRF